MTTGEPNSASGEAENRTVAASPEGPARAPCAPAAHQPDGHFKRRSLRCRSRRNRHKLREPEPSAPAPEASPSSSAEATPVEEREADPSADERQGSRASPPAEMSPEVTRVLSKVDEVVAVAAVASAAAAAPDRIPSLPLGPQEQQKRKCFEQTASPSFPEKKPRLEDRQSFRNTIESVHPEKPQPTKEEPKVPPIRVGESLGAAACLGGWPGGGSGLLWLRLRPRAQGVTGRLAAAPPNMPSAWAPGWVSLWVRRKGRKGGWAHSGRGGGLPSLA